MPTSPQSPLQAPTGVGDAAQSFGAETSRALGESSQSGRLLFASIYAIISLSILPLWTAALWLTAVFAWEMVSRPVLKYVSARLNDYDAITATGVANFLGSCVFG